MEENVRNIGIIAHIDAGKTTTTERILYYTNVIHAIGEIDEGTTTMDWMPEEKARGITITSSAITCNWRDTQINIIDTPGHIDFTGEVERSLRVLDGVVMIFSAVEGVESQSEAVWYQADKYKIPRIVFINKLDRIGAEPYDCVKMINEKLGSQTIEMQIPVGIEDKFYGVCDLISGKFLVWEQKTDGRDFKIEDIPDNLKLQYELKRKELLEILSTEDDAIATLYLDDKPIPEELLIAAIRKLTLSRKYVPIYFGSAFKNAGVQPLLNGIVDFLPSPSSNAQLSALNPNHFCALVFKVYTDPHGKLLYTRIFTGEIETGSYVLNSNTEEKERISQIFLMYSDKRKSIKSAKAGDIVALFGPKNTQTGHTLVAADAKPILLEEPHFPEPVISAIVTPITHKDEEKLSATLQNFANDDPTLSVKTDNDTGELVVSGMGELHLEVLTQRMQREFGINTKLSNPQVAYKETITKAVRERGEFIKQTGGHGQYGDVELDVKPLERGGGFKFKVKIKEGAVPREYWPSVQKGVELSSKIGILAGFPVIDIEVTLTDGSFHPVEFFEHCL